MTTTADPAPDLADATPTTGTAAKALERSRHFLPVLGLVIVIFVVFAVIQDDFATRDNLTNLLTGVSVLWIVSMGMTFVLISGGLDLSVGAVSALVGIFLAKVLTTGMPSWLAVIIAVVFGAACGVLNGFFVARGLSFFVVTLASLTALTGVVNLWSDTRTFFVNTAATRAFAIDNTLGIPNPIWIMAIVFVLALYLQSQTYFGRDVYAVGGSVTAARLSGIRTGRTLVLVYVLCAGWAALASMISVGRIGAAAPDVSQQLPLQAAAAVLIGGTRLHGGSGGVGGTALGVLFIGILSNAFSVAGVPSYWQQIVTGLILLTAVIGDRIRFAQLKRILLRLTAPVSHGRPSDGSGAEEDT